MSEDVEDEVSSMRRELKWLLAEQVHTDLADIKSTLQECCRRFPSRATFGDNSLVKPQRILLSNPNGTGQIKCVVTLQGDCICDADISFKHKQGKDNHLFKTSIKPDVQWKLQQIQDSANHLSNAMAILSSFDPSHVFKTAKQVTMLLGNLMKLLNLSRTCLSFPKRKSIDDLIQNANMQNLLPSIPNDVALSFYIHASKLILAVYHFKMNSSIVEIVSRYQVESTVQVLNEAVILFTLALQQCQQLLDKLQILQTADIS